MNCSPATSSVRGVPGQPASCSSWCCRPSRGSASFTTAAPAPWGSACLPALEHAWAAAAVERSEAPGHRLRRPRLGRRRLPARLCLGEVERRVMDGIASGATDFTALFARFDPAPPLFGFGDGEFLRHLRRLATCAVPMITISEAQGSPPKPRYALTAMGQEVLDGKADYIALNNADLWLGGAHLTHERLWRWDEQAQQILVSGQQLQ